VTIEDSEQEVSIGDVELSNVGVLLGLSPTLDGGASESYIATLSLVVILLQFRGCQTL